MKWITASDLEAWADTLAARDTLPALVADLIRASSSDIDSFRFPSGDKAQVRGFDGSLAAKAALPFVPGGSSVWEFGVNKGAASKAAREYDNRTAQIAAADRANMTFVFVSPRTWDNPSEKLDDWIRTKKELKDWGDVKYIDGVSLEAWLDENPAVAARYARFELGRYPQLGARSTEEFWEEYSTQFIPYLIEDVLLCDRERQAEELLRKLADPPAQIVLAADSPDEVIAFAIAAIRKAKPEVRFFLEARTLIVDNEDAARLLAGRPNLTFLPRAQARQNAGLLAKSSPTLVAIGGDQPNRNYDVLARPSTSVMGKAISTMVNSEERGYELARSCGRSVTILARLIPGGAAALPEWINQGRVLLPALLAGGWTTNSAEDEEIVRSLAGARSYAEFEATLRPLTRLQDPPIDRVQDVWKIRAPVDAFVHLGHLIGADDLDRLREAATAVFSQIEELPNPNELFQLSPKAPKGHSEWLRDGLATTLLQIATLHSQARLVVPGSTPQQYVDEIVRSLPGLSSDHRLLASLGNQLPLLAEAAPDPLLSALELMLGGEGDAIKPIFNETKHVLVPRSAHTGLLWALETLAWDPALLRRVSLVLARLANIDPGGRLGNRPINSLREIFVSWSPNTNASLRQRLAALDYVIPRVPSVAWELVVNLFPKSHDTSMPTAKPKFRESGASDKEALTYGVVWEGHRQIISRALDLAADDPERLAVIITAFGDFEPDLRARTLEIVDAYLARAAKHDHRKVWSALRDEANRNRAYPDAEWSLPQDELARLDAIVQNRQPENLIDRVSWLFDDWTPDLPGPADERINLVETERRAAVQHVLTSQGIDGVLSFAERVKLPQFVAVALVELTNDPEICERVISGALDRSDQIERFADTISGAAARKFGDVWVQRFKRLAARKGWSPETIVSLILTWPDERRTWEMVAQFGTETEESYWRQK